jgi:hydroxyacylglutathione hydrolase
MIVPLRVLPLPALADNYIFALVEPGSRRAALVDPAEAEPALRFLKTEGLALEAIAITHHHHDHVGGVARLAREFPGVRVVGPRHGGGAIPALTEPVREGAEPALLGGGARVLEVPGHTRDHLAYFVPDAAGAGDLFSGDTVFGATIGNLFEGTPDVMFASLVKIRALPPGTRIWCAHEYTLQYVREAARFDPGNRRLAERLARVESDSSSGKPSVPLLLSEERATNPFLRWDDPDLVERLGTPPGLATFRRLCELL